MDILKVMLEVLVGVVLFTAFIGVIISQLNGFDWANVTLGGTSYNFAWFPFLVVFLLIIGIVYGVIQLVKYKK